MSTVSTLYSSTFAVPQCPLEEIVKGFNDKTELLGQLNDTAYPFHYNDTVEVLCQRGYTFPDGDLRKTFMCGMYDDMLGWFDHDNNSLADVMCTKCEWGMLSDIIYIIVIFT